MVNAAGATAHIIGDGACAVATVSIEAVNEVAKHVIYLDVDFARQLLEVKGHLAVVGIRHDGEVGCGLLINIVEGAYQPIFLHDAVIGRAAVIGVCPQPYGVDNTAEHVYLAVLRSVAVRLDDPIHRRPRG